MNRAFSFKSLGLLASGFRVWDSGLQDSTWRGDLVSRSEVELEFLGKGPSSGFLILICACKLTTYYVPLMPQVW